MKKKVVSAMGIVFGMALLSGCGTGEVKDILDQTQSSLSEVKAAAGNMEFQMVVNLEQQGINMDMEASLSGDWKVNSEENAFVFDGTLATNMMNLNADVEIYSVKEGDKQVTYTKMGDTWSKTEDDVAEEDTQTYWDKFEEFTPSTVELAEDGDSEGQTIHFEITGEDVQKLLENAGLQESDLQDMGDIQGLKADIDLTVREEDKLPTAASVDFGTSLSDVAVADEDTNVNITTCKASVNITDYEDIGEITVPEEAKSAQETDGDILESLEEDISGEGTSGESADEDSSPILNEDGSYSLLDYDDQTVASVMIPEGYTLDFAEKTYLSCSKAEDDNGDYISVIYQPAELSEDYTEEDFAGLYLLTDSNIEEYGYSSYETTGPDTLTVGDKEISYLTVKYAFDENMKGSEIVLWQKVDDTHLLYCTVMPSTDDSENITDMVPQIAEEVFTGVNF